MPTNYFQNDEMFRTQIEGGLYSQPFQRPINRVDVRDVGRAAARACLDLNLPSGAYPVVGPESLDALACSRAWSLALEREVVPAHPDVDAFDQVLRQHLHSAKKLSDFRASYRLIRKFTLPTAANDLKQTTALLGRPPIAYATYVSEGEGKSNCTSREGQGAELVARASNQRRPAVWTRPQPRTSRA